VRECVLCDQETNGLLSFIYLDEDFPLCSQCVEKYGVKNIQKAIHGLFLLAVAREKGSIRGAWNAGLYIGAAPEVFAILLLKGITVNLEIVGLEEVRIIDIDWKYDRGE
jgi:hypothetical protein